MATFIEGLPASPDEFNPQDYVGQINTKIDEVGFSNLAATAEFGPEAVEIQAHFLELAQQPSSRRVRGVLTVLGSKLIGGTDEAVYRLAAVSNEFSHTALLSIDDIQDDENRRRDAEALHVSLARVYEQRGGSAISSGRIGEGLTTNTALINLYAAQEILLELKVSDSVYRRASSVLIDTMIRTGHGQNLDLMLTKAPQAPREKIVEMMIGKTAAYTVLGPLRMGLVLAGGDDDDLQAITNYAENLGAGFQVVNDLEVMLPKTKDDRKDSADDILQGKQTLLTYFAIFSDDSEASGAEKRFLQRMLQAEELSDVLFSRCIEILEKSGAQDYAIAEAKKFAQKSTEALEELPSHWNYDAVRGLGYFSHALVKDL